MRLYREIKHCSCPVDLIGEKNQVILEYIIKTFTFVLCLLQSIPSFSDVYIKSFHESNIVVY